MELSQRFTMRSSGTTIGYGVVSKVHSEAGPLKFGWSDVNSFSL